MKLSIISPVYNTEHNIDRCVQSVISQKFKDFELILVDDHSSDSSFDKCKKWQDEDKRIKVIKNPNKGVSSARNAGIKYAKGEYIMFIDSDDSLTANALNQFMMKISSAQNNGIVISTYKTIYSGGKEEPHEIPDFDGDIKSFCQKIEPYLDAAILQGPCWKLFNRMLLIERHIIFPEHMDYGEDTYFVYEYLKYVNHVIVFNSPTYNYYVQNESLSHGFRRQKYTVNLMLNEKLNHLLLFYLGSSNEEMIHRKNRVAFLIHLDDCALLQDRKLSLSEIDSAIRQHQTLESFCGRNLSLKHRIVKFCIVHRMKPCLLLLGKIHAHHMLKIHKEC